MKAGDLIPLGETFAAISLVAVGGTSATLPAIEHAVVGRWGWMDAGTFSHLFAISQASPGPNVMFVSLIGWRVAGLAGLAVATLAMIVPSSILAFVTGRLWRHWSAAPWIQRLQSVLSPIAIGLIAAGGVLIARNADHDLPLSALTVAAAAFVVFTRRNPLWALAAGAGIGVAVSLAGWRL